MNAVKDVGVVGRRLERQILAGMIRGARQKGGRGNMLAWQGSRSSFEFEKVDILKCAQYSTMARLLPGLLFIFLHAASLVAGTALTYKLSPGEKSCFFTDVKQQGVKIAFYFAVSIYTLITK